MWIWRFKREREKKTVNENVSSSENGAGADEEKKANLEMVLCIFTTRACSWLLNSKQLQQQNAAGLEARIGDIRGWACHHMFVMVTNYLHDMDSMWWTRLWGLEND